MTRLLVKLGFLGVVVALWGVLWSTNQLDAQISTSSGTMNAKQSGTWTVQPGNTANTTAWKVDGSAVTQPISGTITSVTQFNGQAISLNTGLRDAGTLRVTVATNDVVPASQSGTWTVQPGNTANTTAWLVTQAPLTSFLSNQQAVTATATALATNTVKGVCVKALSANTINIYVGASAVTTTTGDELAPGDGRCYPLNNTNLIFVIASGTGASVSWSAWN